MIVIEGSIGGGQILRTALSLSMITQKPFKITNIRIKRQNPGLQRQHLTCVNSAKEISKAGAKGDYLGSTELEFTPGKIEGGEYTFDIGTAGSTTLVLQTLLPALLFAEKQSTLTVIGGTENPMAPPSYDFKHLFLSVLNHYNIHTELEILKHGYYPKGGGKLALKINPAKEIKAINITESSAIEQIDIHIEASASLQKPKVAERILKGFQENFKLSATIHKHLLYSESLSPGCFIHAHIHYLKAKPGVTVLGEIGKRAEDVGKECALKLADLINSKVPVDEHTADQLLIYMALKPGSNILANKITGHTLANIKIIEMFLDVKFSIDRNFISCSNIH